MNLDELLEGPLTRRHATLGLAAMFIPSLAQAQRSKSKQAPRPRAPAYQIDDSYALDDGKTRTRKRTDYIILHTTEGEFAGAARHIRKGKHANYLLDRDGTLYPIVQVDDVANHAGKSLWHGQKDISNVSVGIEIVGYHYAPLTDAQYRTLNPFVHRLMGKYKLADNRVLGHYQIAANKNPWSHGKLMRGRRKDGMNINWARVGIKHDTRDVDFEAGDVLYDSAFAKLIKGQSRAADLVASNRQSEAPAPVQIVKEAYGRENSNVIANGRTPWTIVGELYNYEDTFYVFPNGSIKRGDKIGDDEWGSIPAGTRVFSETDEMTVRRMAQPIITYNDGTLWSKVQSAYNDRNTCYILPDATFARGDRIRGGSVPYGTKIVLGCSTDHLLTSDGPKSKVGGKFNTDNVLYVFPDAQVLLGTQVPDYNRLPKGTRLLVRDTP
jgi:N-acetylmuramoyl-L-alanine amidase